VADIFAEEGIEGLEKIRGIGPSIGRSIRDILLHGRLAMLDRLRGESEAIAILASVPGIGKKLARRFMTTLALKRWRSWKSRLMTAAFKTIPASARNDLPASAIRLRNVLAAFAEG
jgi:Holliday junction resolvasome RuvABC DNA-binding subunit